MVPGSSLGAHAHVAPTTGQCFPTYDMMLECGEAAVEGVAD